MSDPCQNNTFDGSERGDSGGSSANQSNQANIPILCYVHSRSQSSGDLIMWHKILGDRPRDLPAFPTKNPIFKPHVPDLLGSMRFLFVTFCIVLIFLHLFPVVNQKLFLIICCEICKTSSYICIEVNDKHRDCPPNVMMQNTEYFGLYRNSNIRCDVTPTSRINCNQGLFTPKYTFINLICSLIHHPITNSTYLLQ